MRRAKGLLWAGGAQTLSRLKPRGVHNAVVYARLPPFFDLRPQTEPVREAVPEPVRSWAMVQFGNYGASIPPEPICVFMPWPWSPERLAQEKRCSNPDSSICPAVLLNEPVCFGRWDPVHGMSGRA